jgi:hypothetical protein
MRRWREQNVRTMAKTSTSQPTPTQAAHALKYWLPAIVAIAIAGVGGGIYVSSKVDRAELYRLTDTLSSVKVDLSTLTAKIDETEKRRTLEVAAVVRDELAKTRTETVGGSAHSGSVSQAIAKRRRGVALGE